jgi:hypothetical protein
MGTTVVRPTVASLAEKLDTVDCALANVDAKVRSLDDVIFNMADVIERQAEEIASHKRHIAALEAAMRELVRAAGEADQNVVRPVKLITARYPGHCRSCGKQFASGHTIAYGGGETWHPACSPVSLYDLDDERRIVRHPVDEYEDRRRARSGR